MNGTHTPKQEEEDKKPKAEQTPAEALREGEAALKAWNDVFPQVKMEAEDMAYYAEELWCEDKKAWDTEKHDVMHGKEAEQDFVAHLEALSKKQAPVWDVIVNKADKLMEKLQEPHEMVKKAHANVQKALKVDPNVKDFMNPLAKLFGKALHEDQQELHKVYTNKMRRQFHDAHDEYKELCHYPTGILVHTKLMREGAMKENAHVEEVVHQKKAEQQMGRMKILREALH